MINKKIIITLLFCILLTITATSAADTGSFTDLQNLINTNTDGQIILDKNYTYNPSTDDIIKDNGIIITKDININGNGYTLNGANTSRILKATSTNVEITNTQFIYGYSQNGGAAIHSQDNTNFKVTDCTFQYNVGTTGTAISSYGPITVENCQFLNNDGIKGTAICSESAITVINSIFNYNKAVQEYGMGLGGAIYGKGKITINSSSFTSNTGSKGGAIYGEDDILTENTIFTQNTATGPGGAIYSNKNVETILTIFNTNSAQTTDTSEESKGGAISSQQDVTITNSTFNNNNARDYGGAIYAENLATIKDSDFENNYVRNNYGIERGGAISATTVNVENTNFIENQAPLGGAIDTLEVTSQNNKYQENTATQVGGAIYAETVTTINDQYIKNKGESGGAISSTNQISSTNTQYQENTATGPGGALHSQGTITINNNTFTKNTATTGGAIYTEGTLIATNSQFLQNTATQSGGATYSKTTTIKQSKFLQNTANAEGGAIYISDNHNPITINYNTFKDNLAINGSSIRINQANTNDNINDNWWATNNPNFQTETYGQNPTNYIIMKATSNNNMITTSLNTENTGAQIRENLPTSTIKYTSNTGTLSTPTEEFIGTSTTLYQPTTSTDTHTVYATIDYQTIRLNLDINTNTTPIEPTNDTNNTNITPVDPTNNTNITPIEPNDTIITILTLNNLNKVFGTDTPLIGTLIDTEGNSVMGQHISLTLIRTTNGQSKTYDVVTDYTGTFQLPINLSPGQYKAKAEYNGLTYKNTTYIASTAPEVTITVTANPTTEIPTIITAKTYTEKINSGIPFTGTLTDEQNTPIPGQHVKLTITRDTTGGSKTYDIVTDYTGTFNLPINLAIGTYSIQCTYTGIGGYQSSAAYTKLTITR